MDKPKLHSPDLTQANIDRLAELFPGCVTEARDDNGKLKKAIDFDQLRQELSDHIVDGPQERYHLNWPGKREALLVANAPIAKTLRPCREESVEFDTTKNLFIEGDNLDVLKQIQETYLGQVKVIYIDPPYNTGKDFVYKDTFSSSKPNYQKESNQQGDDDGWLVANPETSGRYHSNWLTMIYPRMRLAKNLLRDDGVFLASIDDHELANFRVLCDEVFGRANHVATMVWEKGRKNDAKLVSVGHEYILIYAKSLSYLREKKTLWREEKPGARDIWEKYLELREQHGASDSGIENDLQQWFSDLPKKHPAKKWSRYKRIDKHGPWRDRDISWPGGGGPRYDVIHPVTKQPCEVPERGWIYASHAEMLRQIKLGLVEFRDDHTEPPFRKAHIRPIPDEASPEIDDSDEPAENEEDTDLAVQVRGSYFYKQSQVTVKYLRKLMGAKVFTNPKDHIELARLFDYVTPDDSQALFMDFFAGSASTAQAVHTLNRADDGDRRFILVQLPELLDPEQKDQKAAARYCADLGVPQTIAEIAKERIRRVKVEIEDESQTSELSFDAGFRVLKSDTSNMQDVYYSPDAITQDDLYGQIDNIKPDRSGEDLLFQVMLDWGLDLASPIQRETIAGKTVYFVDGDDLAACFDTGIDEAFVKELAQRKPLRAVFRDTGYGSDNTKINVAQIFRLVSSNTEVKSI